MPRRGRGGARCGCHGADDQAGADGAALDCERVEQCADGAAASRTTAPGALQAQASQAHRLRAGLDGGRIMVTKLSTLRLPVVAEMSRARWLSSPTARSCGCLHRGSNAQAVSKAGEAARSHVRWRAQVASRRARGGRRASRRAHSWDRRVRERTARVHLQHVLSRARSGRADRKLRALHAWLPAGPGAHLRVVGWCPWTRRGW